MTARGEGVSARRTAIIHRAYAQRARNRFFGGSRESRSAQLRCRGFSRRISKAGYPAPYASTWRVSPAPFDSGGTLVRTYQEHHARVFLAMRNVQPVLLLVVRASVPNPLYHPTTRWHGKSDRVARTAGMPRRTRERQAAKAQPIETVAGISGSSPHNQPGAAVPPRWPSSAPADSSRRSPFDLATKPLFQNDPHIPGISGRSPWG